MEIVDLLLLAGAIAWFSTTLAIKEGPFGVFLWLREHKLLLNCAFCTGFWVGLGLYLLQSYLPVTQIFIQFFGILGLAAAIRGQSQEF